MAGARRPAQQERTWLPRARKSPIRARPPGGGQGGRRVQPSRSPRHARAVAPRLVASRGAATAPAPPLRLYRLRRRKCSAISVLGWSPSARPQRLGGTSASTCWTPPSRTGAFRQAVADSDATWRRGRRGITQGWCVARAVAQRWRHPSDGRALSPEDHHVAPLPVDVDRCEARIAQEAKLTLQRRDVADVVRMALQLLGPAVLRLRR